MFIVNSLRSSTHCSIRRINYWLWAVFFLTIVWLLRVSLDSGLNIHLFGAMLMALMFGWRMGVLGLSLANVLVALFRDALWVNIGTAIILNAVVPVSVACFIFLLLEYKLPRHFFIYIYGSAFFGAWLTNACAGLAIALVLGAFNVFTWSLLSGEYLPYFLLFGFSEAFLTSGLITLFVVYRPDWVYSFRDQQYLNK